jgi:hypothetical protein
MTIDRRDLIVGAAATAAVAPTFKLLPSLLASDETGLRPVTFAIEGWSSQEDSETANLVWMRIGQSWRTAWR